MRNFALLLTTVLLVSSCNMGTSESYSVASIDIISTQDPGKELLTQYCYACHNPTATMENRLAPPMIAVKNHYKGENTTREEFVEAIWSWVEEPSEAKSQMPGALTRFGVMPYQKFDKKDIEAIANYMFDSEIEQPEWFEKHQGKKKGKNNKQKCLQ